MQLRPRIRGRGFTLIELMVTISLFAVLVMLSAPAFTSWVRNSQVRTAAETLQGGFRVAQAEALRRNRQVVLFFTDDNPAKNVTSTHVNTDAAPSLTGKKWALQTVPGSFGIAEYITGGAVTDVATTVSLSNDQSAKAMCWNSNGRLATTAADPTATGTSGTTGINAACAAATTTFAVAQSTAKSDDRPLRVVLQLGGQLRMCDPAKPPLSPTSPDGCP